jgi:hypothetical protein
MNRAPWAALLFSLIAGPAPAARAADGRVYYDGRLAASPAQQGLVFLTNPLFGAGVVQGATNEGWLLDSRAQRGSQAGWFSRLPFNDPDNDPRGTPAMDRRAGFHVSFTLQVLAEEHATTNRAGFSVIALSADLWGIELGFWTNAVFAQSGADFVQAEGAAFDTRAARRRYDVLVRGDGYALSVDGQPLLTGPLRNYAAFGAPYNAPRFTFVGDDTSSASARFVLGRLAVFPLPRLALARGPAAGEVTFTLTAEPDRPWSLERSLDAASWLGFDVLAGPTNVLTRTEAVAAEPGTLYRVRAATTAEAP